MSDRGDDSPANKIKRLMREASSERPSNVADFFTEAQKRGRAISPPAQEKPLNHVQITGSGNAGVIGDGNNIQINVKAPANKRPQINLQAGPENITDAQAAEVKELVDKVATVAGKPHSFVWSTLKRKYRFTKYQLITHDKYEDIVKYLRMWIARYSRAPKSINERRSRTLARIHAEAKKQKGLLDNVHAYIQGRFGTPRLSELSQGQLNEVVSQFRF